MHPEAVTELNRLPVNEFRAMSNALDKMDLLGDQLGFPHTSNVEGADRLRELRPRQGRSPWRAFYRRIGNLLVVAAIGPEASVDPRGFRRAVQDAERRLAIVEQEQKKEVDRDN